MIIPLQSIMILMIASSMIRKTKLNLSLMMMIRLKMEAKMRPFLSIQLMSRARKHVSLLVGLSAKASHLTRKTLVSIFVSINAQLQLHL